MRWRLVVPVKDARRAKSRLTGTSPAVRAALDEEPGGKVVAIVGPTYAEHELNWRRHGHDVRVVADLEAADVVVVVNPDNPTGRLLPPQALRAVMGLDDFAASVQRAARFDSFAVHRQPTCVYKLTRNP